MRQVNTTRRKFIASLSAPLLAPIVAKEKPFNLKEFLENDVWKMVQERRRIKNANYPHVDGPLTPSMIAELFKPQ